MPLYLRISTEPRQHARDTEGEDTKGIRDIEDMSLHWRSEEAHKFTNPLTDPLLQEEHVSNADKWVTSLETAQERENK